MTPREVVKSFWQAMESNDFYAAGRWLAAMADGISPSALLPAKTKPWLPT